MAIAPLPDRELLDALTATRPPLRLLSFPGEGSRAADQVAPVVMLTRERQWSQARRRRLRRSMLAVAACGLAAGLAVPVSALAGTAPAPPHPLVAGTADYVVQPGDTLATIAARFAAPGEQGALVARLAAETGSDQVVAGEHLVVP